MTGFVEGSYIDDDRMIHNADGSLDGRFVDAKGWIHLSTGDLDGNWFIDAQGQVHDERGMPSGQTVGIPQSWTVFYEPNPDDSVSWDGALTQPGEAAAEEVMRRQFAERTGELSSTYGTSPGEGALNKFVEGLERPPGAPYAAGYGAVRAADRKPEYEGEESQLGWRAPDDPNVAAQDGWVTKYEDRTTIADRAARTGTDPTAEGFVLDSNGEPIHGTWGWVVDEQTGYLLLFDPHHIEATSPDGVTVEVPFRSQIPGMMHQGFKVRTAHHTTPVHGMPVKGAGVVTLDHGRIVEITDESGHYQPDAAQQFKALEELQAQGYDLGSAAVKLTGEGGGRRKRPTGKAEWLNQAAEANPLYPTGEASLRQEQFAQTQGDEYQIRAKIAVNEQLRTTRSETPAAAESPDIRPEEENPYGRTPTNVASQPASPADAPPAHVHDQYRPPVGDDDAQTPVQDAGNREFVEQARNYLNAVGRAAFADWARTLTQEHQALLVADPQIGTAWRAENAPSTAGWQPAENDHAAAATANAAVVDSLDDRQSAVFELGGFSLLIGDEHDARHLGYVRDARDRVTGTVTVRKAGIGRGAGSLTFTGVPPAKQGVVQAAVARFSRKTVNFS